MEEPMDNSDEIEEQAAEWLITMWESQMDEARWAAFYRWISASSRRREVFEQMEAAILLLKQRGRTRAFAVAAAPVGAAERTVPAHYRPRPVGVIRSRFAIAAVVAAVLVSAAIGLAFWQDGLGIRLKPTPAATLVSADTPGTTREVQLADGSIATLNSGTRMQVHFERSRRGISLMDGEVLLAMAHNPRQPVMAVAGDTTVRAAGAKFALRRDDEGQRVLVADGQVEVLAGRGVIRRTLDAGQVAVITSDRVTIQKFPPDAIERKLAWVDGMLWFKLEPLSEVVKEFNRYHERRKLKIEDPRLGRQLVSGRFNIADLDEFAEAIRMSGLATAVKSSDTEVVFVQEKN